MNKLKINAYRLHPFFTGYQSIDKNRQITYKTPQYHRLDNIYFGSNYDWLAYYIHENNSWLLAQAGVDYNYSGSWGTGCLLK
jgi:hypothetical protein